ncbi:MAG: hypothetical protein QOK37_900 [Thermoanaerobaculia bacterium]|jgi:hypothetical protein|nr:hypothetical protein [Thermoanaerobaculia bacterium]
MPDRLEFRYSPEGQLRLLIVACVLVCAALYMALTNADIVYRILGWIAAGFMALCALIAAKRLLAGGVPFVFDLGGISFPGGDFGLVPWSEIKSYKVVTIRGNYFLALTFHDPNHALARVSTLKRRWAFTNQRLGWGHWALTFSGLTPGMDEAIAFIREHTQVRAQD